jgi:hypothetical protein
VPATSGRISKEWLSYIRPHLQRYEALGSGARGDYIAKLSKQVKLSDNTLRRFIAAAQFLEAEGITELPPGGKMPVAAVERIARIAAREPERRRELLRDVAAGKLTVVQLRAQLKKSATAASKRSRAQAQEVPLEQRAKADLEAREIGKSADMVVTPYEEDLDRRSYLDSRMRPAFVIHLPEARRIVVMDDRLVSGTAVSFIMQRKEFLRNVLAGTSLYELVLVYASIWREDVEKLKRAMRPEARQRLILIGAEA